MLHVCNLMLINRNGNSKPSNNKNSNGADVARKQLARVPNKALLHRHTKDVDAAEQGVVVKAGAGEQ